MDVHRRIVGSVVVVSLHGDLDSRTCGAVQERLLELIEPDDHVLIDLTAVGYMSSAGLRTLLLLYRRAKHVRATVGLVGISPVVRTVLAATGFLDHFCVVDTVCEGVATLQSVADRRRVAS